ncbi:MAG: glycerophosphodiester phosphodiesterase [Leucobacter sp.]
MQRTVTAAYRRSLVHAGLIAWGLAVALVLVFGVNPHATPASALQAHGALQRHDNVGIISHRGAAAVAPENTLAATGLAIELGADFVEVDLQLTSDGVPVLMHDDTVDRTTSGSGAVGSYTYEEIRTLDAGQWFSAEYAGERVPTLEEFIQLIASSPTGALIELKGDWPEERIIEAADLLRSHNMLNTVALQSFELPTLEMLHEAAPEYARVLLTRELDDAMLETARELQVSAIGARAGLYDEAPETVAAIRALGIGALVYTLNEEAEWGEAVYRGNDLIITDDPVSLGEWRARE